MSMSMMEAKKDEDPQGILDDHMIRIWDNSSGQTPSRSPGRHSPDRNLLSKSHFVGPSPNVSTTHYPSFIAAPGNKSVHHSESHHLDSSGAAATSSKVHHRKKDKQLQQQQDTSLPFDTSVIDDRHSSSYYEDSSYLHNKHSVQIHHHHHHHHHTPKDSKRAEHEQLNHSKGGSRYGGERVTSTVVYDDRNRAIKQQTSKRLSDSSATGDSGVYLYNHSSLVPNVQDTSNEK